MTALQTFEAARQQADGRRRLAIRVAHERKAVARRDQLTEWEARKALAEIAFEDVKSDADHPEHNALRDALDALQVQPSDRPLLSQLDADVRAADQSFHSEVAELRREYGISPLGTR